jgi:hypothetical protein
MSSRGSRGNQDRLSNSDVAAASVFEGATMLGGPARGTLVVFFAICELLVSVGQQRRVSAPFLLDHNRVFADFVRPDGTIRKARAFVDMGLTFSRLT